MPDPADRQTSVQDTATLLLRRQELPVQAGLTVRAAIVACGLEPDAFIVSRAGELIAEDEVLRPGDRIKLLRIPSGG
ncbi:MAG: MoaD/ThiS family protein [Chloroflexota bacterium]|jgi:sulfur carrier protein ThiS